MSFYELKRLSDNLFQVHLDEGHVLYQAHFPSRPILPGSCIAEIVRDAAECLRQKSTHITKAVQLKFIKTISAEIDNDFYLSISFTDSEKTNVKAVLKKDEQVYCKATLILTDK